MARLVKKEVLGKARVYDVTVSDTHSFFAFSAKGVSNKAVVVHNCHRMSADAQDVLLKPIEDDRMVAILCTTEAAKIRGTIVSRCQKYSIRKVTRENLLKRMQMVLTKEGVTFEDDAVLTVIDASGGHVRDILNRLEMIAQLGAVTLDKVREYLNLGLVTVYYDTLLALGDANESIRLVEAACERAPAEDVCAGIAEAAMNSYRLANGLTADFTYTDREKAEQVYERFKEGCLERAAFFLSRRYATKNSLVCDVVRLARGVPKSPDVTASAPAPMPPPAPVLAPVPTATPAAAPVAPSASAAPPAASAAPPVVVPVVAAPVIRIGNLGSSDPEALTDEDARVVPNELPRWARKIIQPSDFSGPGNKDDSELLTPDEWRREFARTWGLLGGGLRV
jgi:DNA polymerase III gamma/tau subunit